VIGVLRGHTSGSSARRLWACGLVALLAGVLFAGVLSPGPALATGALTGPSPYVWGISCSSNSLCVAVGSKGRVVTSTNPTAATPTWIGASINGSEGGGFLSAVSCASTTLCVAIDLNSRPLISTDPAAATPTWSAPAYIGEELGIIESISCPSTSLCVAVDNHGHAATSTTPAAAAPTWRISTIDSVSPPPYGLTSGVSCPSTSLCVAVDDRGRAVISSDPAAETPTWTAPAAVDSTGLLAISCPSTSLCVAVDEAGRAVISTDPRAATPTWSAPVTINNSPLTGISCPTTSLCVAITRAGRRVITTDPTSATPTWSGGAPMGSEGFAEIPARISCASTSLCVMTGAGGAVISIDPTAATPTWSAQSDIDATGAGTTSLLGSPLINGPTLRFNLGCSANALGFGFQECPGASVLTTTERLAANGRTVTGVAAKSKRRRVVVIGRTTFIADTGQGHTLSTFAVTLNNIGRRLLARFKHLPATLTVTANAPELRVPPNTITVKTVKVTFRAKPKTRRKH
jgi:hypothetical protein